MKTSSFLLLPSAFQSLATSYSLLATAPKALSSFILLTSDFISLPLNPKICEYVGPTLFPPVKTPVKTPVKILQLLKEKPDLSLAELAVLLGKSVRTIERASAKLVKAGELRRIGPDKGGRWEVGAKSEG